MSTTTSFAGLASGFDWKTFVNSIISASSAPITNLQNQQATNTKQVNALAGIQGLLTTMQGAATSLADPTIFGGRQVSSATPNSTWTPLADTDTAVGSYQITVSRLASSAALNGASDLGAALSTSSDVSGLTMATLPTATAVTAGTLTINGKQVTIASTDSLSQVFANIATATGNTVTASYDNTTDKVTLNSTGGEIILGAANDTSNLFSVLKLANNGGSTITSGGSLGVVATSATIANARLLTPITAVDGSGNGTFTINGVNISYNVNTDTIGSVITSINQAGAGVTAGFDAANDRITLTNNITGDLGISVNEASGGLLGALGLTTGGTLVHGTNAQFSVNGGPTRTSTSNALTSTDLGVAGLSLTVNTLDTQTLAVSANTSAMNTAISNLVTAFNSIQSSIDTNTAISSANGTVTTSVLSGNHEVQDWGTSLRNILFNAVPGLTGSVKQLNDLGIDFVPGTDQLAIVSSTKLNAALSNHAADVAAYFQTNTTGLAYSVNTYLTNIIANDTSQQTTLNQNNKDLTSQIATIQANLDNQRAQLTAGFVAMESSQSAIQSQLAALNSAFGGSSSSSSSSSSSGKLTSS